MKKILTTLYLFLSLSSLFSQTSFKLWYGTTNVSNGTMQVSIAENTNVGNIRDIKLENTTGNNINYRVERILVTNPICSGTDVSFCAAGLCFAPSTDISQISGTDVILAHEILPSGNGTYGIEAHFDVGETCCSADIMYRVFNTANPLDFVVVTIQYQCALGVEDIQKIGGTISPAYPNPVNEFASIKYNINEFSQKGKIVFYDMLGKSVKEVILQDKQGIAKINVSDFNSGIYFYTFMVDEKAIITKKMVVSSR